MELSEVVSEVVDELIRATNRFGPFASAHEGYAVLLEELDELWADVKANKGYTLAARTEAKQVAAMAMRYMMDIHLREESNERSATTSPSAADLPTNG